MPVHALFKSGFAPIATTGIARDTVRAIIDQGYTYRTPPIGQDPLAASFGGFGGLGGARDTTGGVPTIQGTPPTGWSGIVRDAIDLIFGGRGGDLGVSRAQEPITDLPVVPDWIDRMISGTIPRGGVPYISMPDGTTGCPSGYHPEKSGKGYCVRNRRMNSLNPRALSRASRRVGGFARAVKRARTLKKVCRSL